MTRLGAAPPPPRAGFHAAGAATLQPAPAPPMRAVASRAAGDWLTAWLGVVWQRRSSPCAPPQRPPKLIALALSPARLRREGPRRLARRLLSLLTPGDYITTSSLNPVNPILGFSSPSPRWCAAHGAARSTAACVCRCARSILSYSALLFADRPAVGIGAGET